MSREREKKGKNKDTKQERREKIIIENFNNIHLLGQNGFWKAPHLRIEKYE